MGNYYGIGLLWLFPSQHYQKDADGLCCRLKYSIDKKDDVSVVVNMEDFKKQGWAIKKKDITKKNIIGKGEFGGERIITCFLV